MKVIIFTIFTATYILKKITPDTSLLCHLLASMDDKWHEIGIAFSVPKNVLSGLDHKQCSNTIKLFEVINSWITTESKHPVTWETVISAIEGPVVDNKQRATEIKEYLIAHYTKDSHLEKISSDQGIFTYYENLYPAVKESNTSICFK